MSDSAQIPEEEYGEELVLPPVLDSSKKLMGVVREIEIFTELANSVLQA